MTQVRENGATSGAGLLAVYAYDDHGRRTSLTRGNGTVTSYSYDNVSRMSQIVQNLSGTSQDLTLDFTYNPASHIATNTRSNDSYAWTGHYAINRSYTANGLNQYTASGSVNPTYDSRGNVQSAGGSSYYTYTSENMLSSAWGQASLAYDPIGRLFQIGGASTTRMAYDGATLIAEYDSGNSLQRRYVHGPGTDEPLVRYEGTGTSDRRWYHADERGSIVAVSNGSGAATNVNTYDEYGIPGSGNSGRFQYTGQQWLGDIGMYHYRARLYSPTLGRFLQTDPIGYGGGMNLYGYVGNDSVNFADPSGLIPTYSACIGSRLCLNVKTQDGRYAGTYPAVGASVSSVSYERRIIQSSYDGNGKLVDQSVGPWLPYFPAGGTGFGGPGGYNASEASWINECAASQAACLRLASAQTGTFIESLPTDELGFHFLNRGTMTYSPIIVNVQGLSYVRLFTRFAGPTAGNPLVMGYGTVFLDYLGGAISRNSIAGPIGLPFSRFLAVPGSATTLRIFPTADTPAGTQVIIRGRW